MMNKVLGLVLALILPFGSLPVYAENVKNERVYLVTDETGDISELTDIVRLENADGLDTMTDRSALSDIENLSGEEGFTQDGEDLVWDAKGADVVYQGTSDKAPELLPVFRFTVDGEEVNASALEEAEGEAEMEITFRQEKAVPMAAAVIIPLPGEGIDDVCPENAYLIKEAGKEILVGIALPGISGTDRLPDSIHVSFHVDHAALSYALTIASADPLQDLCGEVDNFLQKQLPEAIEEEEKLLEEEAETAEESDEAAAPEEPDKTAEESDEAAAPEETDETAEKEIAEPDLSEALDDFVRILEAVEQGEEIPETGEDFAPLVTKLNALNEGVSDLSEGAQQLSEGSAELSSGTDKAGDGAKELRDGLGTLAENNDQLNEGAQAIFEAILSTASTKLAESGLAEAGIELTELTPDNYEAVMDGYLAALDPDSTRQTAFDQVSEQVRPQVEAKTEEIRAAVVEKVREKVKEAVLLSAGIPLTPAMFDKGVENGMFTQEKKDELEAAVDAQMESDEVKEKIEEALQEQIEKLVKENTDQYIDGDETIQAKLSEAKGAYDSLKEVKEQLTQAGAFVSGLKTYTEGVSKASAGSEELTKGLEALSEGAGSLAEGAGLLKDGTGKMKEELQKAEKDAASAILSFADGDLRTMLNVMTEVKDQLSGSGYDLRPDTMRCRTTYVIRTALSEN